MFDYQVTYRMQMGAFFAEVSEFPEAAAHGATLSDARNNLIVSLGYAAHRKLRGRYWLALPLAIIGGLAGAFFGWKSQVPTYRSAGSIMIQYQLDSVFNEKHTRFIDAIPMYEEFLTTQTYVITARRTPLHYR